MAASATSYASSTVCGTIVRSVCSRSQGHSRRSRSVSSWRSTSASARPTYWVVVVVAPVTDAHGSGLGWYPTWYLIPALQELFFLSVTHFVITSFLRCCSSCCLI